MSMQQEVMRGMTDIHCHILPGVDDGAESPEEALEMARMALHSGVRTIIATPHCNLPGTAVNYRTTTLAKRFSQLRQAVQEAKIPVDILPGAEILCTPQIGRLIDEGKLLTLAGSRYLLVEFYFDEAIEEIDEMLETIRQHRLVPVIAHPERYSAVQQEPRAVGRWFRSGYVIQLNKGSILGRLGSRSEETAHWILDHGFAHLVASDGHTAIHRTPHMTELRHYLQDRWGSTYTDILLRENPGRIVRDLPILQAD